MKSSSSLFNTAELFAALSSHFSQEGKLSKCENILNLNTYDSPTAIKQQHNDVSMSPEGVCRYAWHSGVTLIRLVKSPVTLALSVRIDIEGSRCDVVNLSLAACCGDNNVHMYIIESSDFNLESKLLENTHPSIQCTIKKSP